MKKLLLASLVALTLNCLAAFTGPFDAEGAGFYFVHKGGPLKLSLDFTTAGFVGHFPVYLQNDGAIVGRIFDAEERLVFWDYIKVKKGETKTISHDFGKTAPAGIYQIRYSGANIKVNVKSEPELKYGFAAFRAHIKDGRNAQYNDTYIYIPENIKEFRFRSYGGKTTFTDPNGKQYVINNTTDKISVDGFQGKVWKFNPDCTFFGFAGVTAIICPDEETAMAIRGSLERTEDGAVYPHKFQVRIHNWLEKIKKTDLKMDRVDLKPYIAKMESEPQAAQLLGPLGIFTYINDIIQTQNIDPASPDFGKAKYGEPMAVILGINKPYNPFYRHPVFEKRVMINILKGYLSLKESGTREDSNSEYCGSDGLIFNHNSRAFYFGYEGVTDPEAKALWCEAVRHIPDRFSMFRVSAENQSSHWPYIYLCLDKVFKEAKYAEMAKDYIFGMSLEGGNHTMKTGYQGEGYGADGTYQGLGTCYQAVYYCMTGDPVAKKTLQTIYDFYNHSVARDPNGRVYGASNYGHRTQGSWVNRQYGGGTQFMRKWLPEAAVWYPTYKPIDLKKAIKEFKEREAIQSSGAKYSVAIWAPFYSEYIFPTVPLKDCKFPMELSNNFTRNFNNEFLAVRKPAYYTFNYVGSTASGWVAKFRPKKEENKEGSNKWTYTQGMGLLWFQDYGTVITAMNWNGNTGYFLRADLENGECAYPDYWKYNKTIEEDCVNMNSQMFNLDGLKFTRKISFNEKGVEHALNINFEKDVNVKALYDQIPLLRHKDTKLEYFNGGAWKAEADRASKIRINGTIVISLDKERAISLGPLTNKFTQPVQPLRIHLSNSYAAGGSDNLVYTITKE